jgi:hypothetical protein
VNFLQLCQRLAHEAGVNGPGPTTVVGQNGSLELGRIVNWTNDAWLNIQGRRLWSWMWTNAALTLTAGNSTIAGALAPERYDTDSAYYADGSATGRWLQYLPWDEFRHDYRVLGTVDGITAWTVRPDNTLVFNAAASVDRTITIERWANPTSMAADTDIPGLPEDLHMLIVWRGLIKYAGFDEAGVQRSVAVEEHNQLWSALVSRCLPQMRLGGPLGDE